jgi:two-component system chemotaxis sensor kinase CheA
VEAVHQAQSAFGEVAVAQGLVRPDHVEAALAEQNMIRSSLTEREGRQESATIRVRKEKLDSLVDLVGELVILQAILDLEAQKEPSGAFATISENLARLAADLRDTTMNIRMVPLEESFASFQRLTRDLSRQVGKELRLEVSGGSTELDKNIIEALKDPLVHILRNTADHGIELPEVRRKAGKEPVGKIQIGARQVGSRVEIVVADDGGGLNLAKIKARAVENKLMDPSETNEKRIMSMIFEPGFSTAAKTTGLSGRGVGMDVVKRNIEKLRGEVSLQSEEGKGMAVTLSIPLTLVIVEGLLVRVAGTDYVISLSQVEECVDLTDDLQVGAGDGTMIDLRGRTIPIVSVREILGITTPYEGLTRLVIVQNDGINLGLAVDAVMARKQVVIKPLSGSLRPIKILSGATILGDGSVALILDVAEIMKAKNAEYADL